MGKVKCGKFSFGWLIGDLSIVEYGKYVGKYIVHIDYFVKKLHMVMVISKESFKNKKENKSK